MRVWRMRLAVSQARVTDEEMPWQGWLEIVVRARSRQDAIASVRLAEGLRLPDGRRVGLVRYIPVSLRETESRRHQGAAEEPRIVSSGLQRT
jgi:hypothetical protein